MHMRIRDIEGRFSDHRQTLCFKTIKSLNQRASYTTQLRNDAGAGSMNIRIRDIEDRLLEYLQTCHSRKLHLVCQNMTQQKLEDLALRPNAVIIGADGWNSVVRRCLWPTQGHAPKAIPIGVVMT